jgi:hypothetical protein
MDKLFFKPDYCDGVFWKRIKWRYSAAAAAIHFYTSLCQSTRLRIKNILLREHRESIAHPEYHALGETFYH